MSRISNLILALMVSTAPPAAQAAVHGDTDAETMAAFKDLQLLDQRMNAIGYQLVAGNAVFCDEKQLRAGMLLHDIEQYADKKAARFALGFEKPIEINAIAPNSPAALAGLMTGDGLLSINGQPVDAIAPTGAVLQHEKKAYRRIAAVNQLLADALKSGEANLQIIRKGGSQIIVVKPAPTCPSSFQIEVSENRNASATGELISVTSELAAFFESDDEFAAVVAHELAHNLLRHRDRLNAQKVNRGFFGQLGKSAGRIKEAEIEADRLSVWLMVNAGYDPRAAIRFWTRYGKRYGKGIFSASTHYRWKKRVKLFEEEIVKMEAIRRVEGKLPPPLLAAR